MEHRHVVLRPSGGTGPIKGPLLQWVAALTFGCALLLGAQPASAADSGSVTFLSSPTDGHLRLNGDDGWAQLRDSTEAAEVYDSLRYVKINTRPDIIYRGYLFFDTSSLPDNVDISAARLHIYSKCTGDLDDTQLYILGGNDEYPHEPLIPEDFAVPFDSLPMCARIDVGGWADGLAYRTLDLDNAAAVVNTSGTTKLCLLERRDYENVEPPDLHSENEIKLYSFEEGEGYQPYLEVFWGEVPPETPDGGISSEPQAESASTGAVAILAGVAVLAFAAVVVITRRHH
jgi:hypothetical protein